jgi:hypothetical protein
LGLLLGLLGLAIAIGGLSPKASEDKVDQFSWPTLLLVLGSVVLFGVLLQPLGVVVSIFVLVVISSFASHEFRWKSAVINALVLIAMSYAVFVWALKLQFPLWPAFFGI